MFLEWKKFLIFSFLAVLTLFALSKISSLNSHSRKSTPNTENVDERRKKMFGLDKVSEFKNNPKLLDKWTENRFAFSEISEWLKAGVKPNEYEFAKWIILKKSQQFSDFTTQFNYQTPHWIKKNVNVEELRKEYQKEI